MPSNKVISNREIPPSRVCGAVQLVDSQASCFVGPEESLFLARSFVRMKRIYRYFCYAYFYADFAASNAALTFPSASFMAASP